jgi:hypothetical protein
MQKSKAVSDLGGEYLLEQVAVTTTLVAPPLLALVYGTSMAPR